MFRDPSRSPVSASDIMPFLRGDPGDAEPVDEMERWESFKGNMRMVARGQG